MKGDSRAGRYLIALHLFQIVAASPEKIHLKRTCGRSVPSATASEERSCEFGETLVYPVFGGVLLPAGPEARVGDTKDTRDKNKDEPSWP